MLNKILSESESESESRDFFLRVVYFHYKKFLAVLEVRGG